MEKLLVVELASKVAVPTDVSDKLSPPSTTLNWVGFK